MSRGTGDFDQIAYWNTAKQSWDEPAAIMNCRYYLLRLAKINWNRPFIRNEL